MIVRLAIFCGLISIFFASQPAQAKDLTVTGLRLGENGKTTRFVVDLDREPTFRYLLLADPFRVVLDLPEAEWQLPYNGASAGRGLIEKFRYGQFRAGVSRIVLDLAEPAIVKRIFVLPPQGSSGYRLVVDLSSADRTTFLAAMKGDITPLSEISPAAASPRLELDNRNDRRRVVIDAGHGGVDPGAPSAIGVPEKTVALKMSQSIRNAIGKDSRYEIVMTRDGDVFLPLRERVEVARGANADLFISIHADSISDRKVRGATVYTLSERASDQEAATLARKENRADLIAGIDLGQEPPEVTSILIDLAQRESMNYSARFASFLVPELQRRVYLRKNAHRFGGFVVLKAPDIPSVLLEMGYLSNVRDAKYLTSRDGRAQLSTAVASAVYRYFDTVTAEGF